MDFLKKGQDLLNNFKTLLMDDENIQAAEGEAENQNVTTTEDAAKSPQKPSLLSVVTSFFNGAGIGMLLGILVGLAISPVVSGFIGTLSGLLAVLLGLSDKFISPVKAIRLGAFGFFCVGGIFLGMHVRINNVLMPDRSIMMEEYTDVGFDEDEARDFIAFREFRLVPVDWKETEQDVESDFQNDEDSDETQVSSDSKTAQAKTTSKSKKKKTKRTFADPNETGAQRAPLLYSSEVNLSQCGMLEFIKGDEIPLEEIKNSFRMADEGEVGVWTKMADGIDPNLPAKVQKQVLVAMIESFCKNPELKNLTLEDCTISEKKAANMTAEELQANLSKQGHVWSALVSTVLKATPKEYHKSILINLLTTLCND